MATLMTSVARDHELRGGRVITVQQEAILTELTMADSSTVLDDLPDVVTTVAEFQNRAPAPTLAALTETSIHLHGLPANVVTVDVYDAMSIIDVGVLISLEPICDTTELMEYHAAGRHEPGNLPTWEIGSQPGALDLGYNLGTHDIPTDIQALPESLLSRLDNVILGDQVSGADVEGIFSITLSRENRSVDVDLDLGWGIVVGGLSRDDFNEILAFPRCFE